MQQHNKCGGGHFRPRIAIVMSAAIVLLMMPPLAADWPTYRHDNARSGIASDPLPETLSPQWTHTPRYRPQPAWQGPARTDGWHKSAPLKPRMIFDWAFHVVMDAERIYFGSSADDKVYCLDAASGEERWSFFTEGPVRLAPTLADGKLYVGSDDGFVYCLDAANGALVWKFQAAPGSYRLPGNARVMSLAPVRTGVLVDDGKAYFCSGLFSFERGQICALDAGTGAVVWQKATNQALQGYLLASRDQLYAPRGRMNPAVFRREDGQLQHLLDGTGGSFAVLVDDYLFYGPGRTGQIEAARTDIGLNLVTFEGNTLVVHEGVAYMQGDTQISALDRRRYLELATQRKGLDTQREAMEKRLEDLDKAAREQTDAQFVTDIDALVLRLEEVKRQILETEAEMGKCLLWKQESAYPYALIMAGDRLFAGGLDEVAAVNPSSGVVTWTAPVNGRALEIATADGRLIVSTDEGAIHCFSE